MKTMSLLLALAASFTLASRAPGQSPERIAVLSEPGTPVVAAEFLLSVGPADEEARLAGLAYLSAHTIVAPLRPAFDSLGVQLSVTGHKGALSFSLIAAPDAWEEASAILLEALFRNPPDSLSLTTERRRIVRELTGRLSNPADAATRDLDSAFFGADHPWGRPTVGTAQTLERISLAHVDTFLRVNLPPDRAFAAVAGPVEASAVRAHLVPLLGATFPAPIQMVPFESAERTVRREYNSITSWVSASFSFPETGDEEALRFVSFLAADALSFSPSQREVYNVWNEVVPRVGGGEIRIFVVVPPEEAEEWAERVIDAIDRLTSESMHEDVF